MHLSLRARRPATSPRGAGTPPSTHPRLTDWPARHGRLNVAPWPLIWPWSRPQVHEDVHDRSPNCSPLAGWRTPVLLALSLLATGLHAQTAAPAPERPTPCRRMPPCHRCATPRPSRATRRTPRSKSATGARPMTSPRKLAAGAPMPARPMHRMHPPRRRRPPGPGQRAQRRQNARPAPTPPRTAPHTDTPTEASHDPAPASSRPWHWPCCWAVAPASARRRPRPRQHPHPAPHRPGRCNASRPMPTTTAPPNAWPSCWPNR